MTSEDIILDTSEKCLQLIAPRLAPRGRMSVIWLHSRVTYFLNREPAPWSSESRKNTDKYRISSILHQFSVCIFFNIFSNTFALVFKNPFRNFSDSSCNTIFPVLMQFPMSYIIHAKLYHNQSGISHKNAFN